MIAQIVVSDCANRVNAGPVFRGLAPTDEMTIKSIEADVIQRLNVVSRISFTVTARVRPARFVAWHDVA
jgi:hypothetical protein